MVESVFPPPPIQPPPSGLLGMMGIKSMGRNPTNLAPVLAPTFDLVPFYQAGVRSILLTSGAVANVNNSSITLGTVPQGVVWIIESISANAGPLGAAANVTAWIIVTDPAGNHIYFGAPTPKGLTGEVIEAILVPVRPFIALPGSKITVFSTAAAAPTAFNWFGTAVGMQAAA